MPVEIHYVGATGDTLNATIERVSDGFYFNPTQNAFQDGLTFGQKKLALTEGANELTRSYTASVANVSGTQNDNDPGLVRIRIHDENGTTANETISSEDGYVVAGNFIRLDESVDGCATPDDVLTKFSEAILEGPNQVDIPEITGKPPASAPLGTMLSLVYLMCRNRSVSDDQRIIWYSDAGTALLEADISDDEVTYDRGEVKSA
jgi:hypothetical protein